MFTGLIEDTGRVEAVEELAGGERRLTIATRLAGEDLPIGASLAVEGVCLTVVENSGARVALVAAAETLARTTVGLFAVGQPVNLERPLKMGDRLGGHLVAGHVDGVGRVEARSNRGDALDVRIEARADLLRYVIEKGSIAVDGISLTVNRVDGSGFEVSLIPHTQEATTLGGKGVGTAVNLEVDLIGKYVEKLVNPSATSLGAADARKGGITIDKLKEHGFAD
jgi:riboflavin synthase